ncbi:MAG: twin-arginine translocase TatA/TatE family subunit [Planctomycetes bacterium]|nr:twin-arginine translocase TatA/TatE family subunit [Planctomycetota bacterium]
MAPNLGFILPGGMELWIILAIFLLLFGHRIPSMARSMGSGIVEFKKGLRGEDESGSEADKPADKAKLSDGEKQGSGSANG